MTDSQRGLVQWVQFVTVIVGVLGSAVVFMSVMAGIPEWKRETDLWKSRVDREGSWALQEHAKAQAVRFQIDEERLQRLESIVSELKDSRAHMESTMNETKIVALDNGRKLDSLLLQFSKSGHQPP